MIRRNADGSVTVGIIPEDKGAEVSAPSSEEKPIVKKPRKPKKTEE